MAEALAWVAVGGGGAVCVGIVVTVLAMVYRDAGWRAVTFVVGFTAVGLAGALALAWGPVAVTSG